MMSALRHKIKEEQMTIWKSDFYIFGSVEYKKYSVKVKDVYNNYKWAEHVFKVWYVITKMQHNCYLHVVQSNDYLQQND